MTLSELKNGAVVETRYGKRFLKVDNTFISLDMDGKYIALENYLPNLTDISGEPEWDIVKVNNDVLNVYNFCNNAISNVYKGKWTWERETEPYYNGEVVCVDNCYNKSAYTVGKIYEFKDGKIINDKGNMIPSEPIHNFKEWRNFTSAKFIEIVE